MPFPYIRAAGTPYEMGFQHGRQAAAPIAGFLEYLVRSAQRDSREEVLRAARRFLPLFERHCPALLEEVRGVADGAALRFEEALLLQIRGEVVPLLREKACTAFAVSAAGGHGPLIGQTSDMEPELEQFFVVLHLAPRGGPRILMWTFAGQLGYHGLNEYGAAHFANALSGGPAARGRPGGLPHYPVKRLLYECRARAEIMATWEALPVCSSGNYMIASGEPALFDVEVTPEGPAALDDPGEGFLVHANHFLSPRFRTPETDAASLPDSFVRQERMTSLLREHRGELSTEKMKVLLADHHHHPCSICRHEDTDARRMATVAGLIAEPQAGRLHVSRGSPCQNDWTCYTI